VCTPRLTTSVTVEVVCENIRVIRGRISSRECPFPSSPFPQTRWRQSECQEAPADSFSVVNKVLITHCRVRTCRSNTHVPNHIQTGTTLLNLNIFIRLKTVLTYNNLAAADVVLDSSRDAHMLHGVIRTCIRRGMDGTEGGWEMRMLLQIGAYGTDAIKES